MGRLKGLWRRAGTAAADVEWRTAIVRVRFTPVERGRLEEVAREMSLSVSGYLRTLVLGGPLPARHPIHPIPEVNQDVYVELGRIAGGLRPLANRMDRAEPAVRQEILPVLELLGAGVADASFKVPRTISARQSAGAGIQRSPRVTSERTDGRAWKARERVTTPPIIAGSLSTSWAQSQACDILL
jgi:hypothetical protein